MRQSHLQFWQLLKNGTFYRAGEGGVTGWGWTNKNRQRDKFESGKLSSDVSRFPAKGVQT